MYLPYITPGFLDQKFNDVGTDRFDTKTCRAKIEVFLKHNTVHGLLLQRSFQAKTTNN
jgi:hypothetical protein